MEMENFLLPRINDFRFRFGNADFRSVSHVEKAARGNHSVRKTFRDEQTRAPSHNFQFINVNISRVLTSET